MTQIWVALIHYLIVAYIKFLNRIELSLTEITDRIHRRSASLPPGSFFTPYLSPVVVVVDEVE